MTRREASTFASLTDAVVAPVAPLPDVADTDAVRAFARYLDECPRAGASGLRLGLLALDAGPRLLGFGGSLRSLSRERRLRYLDRVGEGRLESLVKVLTGLAHLFYYGDERVMLLLGYDARERVVAGARLREREGRW